MVENIPDCDTVSRLVYFPHMYDSAKVLIWEQIFQFPGGKCESVVWARYAPRPADVHRLGCERVAAKRQSKPGIRYTGFKSSTAGAIRGIRTSRGHGFTMNHAPDEGRRHHAEVCYAPASQNGVTKLMPNDKAELKEFLKNAFGELVSYSCAASTNPGPPA
jgi:hypothetical protein